MSDAHHGHGHSHTHGRGDGWEDLAGSPVRTFLLGVVAVLALATVIGLAIWWPRGEVDLDSTMLGFANKIDATVVAADLGPCAHDPEVECNSVTFELTEGDQAGTTSTVEFETDDLTPASKLHDGDKIVVDDAGPEVPNDARYSYADTQRSTSLWLLAGLFAVAVVVLGRLRGLLALVGIVISLAVLLVYVFPALLHGQMPLGVALTGSSIIAFATLYLAHGITERTTVALIGTMASLLLTALLATVFAGLSRLSGLASEESATLLVFAPGIDFRGLLLAGIVIGTLGVLDDVTITQVSAVWELHHSDPERGPRRLYASAIRIGRDHIASTVNTLVLAYSAAALPLLLLFTQSGLGLGDVLTTETVAVEVVQTLVGSIGLVASVPLTTALACWVITRATTTTDDHQLFDAGERFAPGPVGPPVDDVVPFEPRPPELPPYDPARDGGFGAPRRHHPGTQPPGVRSGPRANRPPDFAEPDPPPPASPGRRRRRPPEDVPPPWWEQA